MNSKERAIEIYKHHIALAGTDGRSFRKTVMEQLMAETGCSEASAATHYNNAKKLHPIEGLGRPPTPKGVRKMGSAKAKKTEALVPDNECFAVMELIKDGESLVVGRYQSFLHQGEASEKFDDKIVAWPASQWVMIKGLGPNSGDNYKLESSEEEIKRYKPAMIA